MFEKRTVQVKVVKDKDLPPDTVAAEADTLTEKVAVISNAALTVLDEGSKVGVKMLTVYIALDTWRKIAIIAASKGK